MGMLLSLSVLLGCSGDIGDPITQPSSGALCANGAKVGVGRWRRLTTTQYQNAIHDLVGVVPDISGFLADTPVTGSPFGANAGVPVQAADTGNYYRTAQTVASQVDLEALTGCASLDDACAETFIEQFGERVFRHPLRAEQLTGLLSVYDVGKQTEQAGVEDPDAGVRLVLEAMLQAPEFLYLPEYGVGDGALKPLSEHELATRLAFLLWNTTPDDALLQAAANGRLSTLDGLMEQAERLMASQRFVEMLIDFHLSLMGADHVFQVERGDATASEALRNAMYVEAQQFVRGVVMGPATIEALFVTDASYPTEELSPVYGLGGDGTLRTGLPGRRGLLTLPAFLTSSLPIETHFAPVYRGQEVRTRLLCQPLPPPAVDIEFQSLGNISPRERLRQHKDDETCSLCHESMDPVGFPLENFDDLGRYREADAEGTIDVSGYVLMGNTSHDVGGPAALGETLAGLRELRECFALQWFRYGLARNPTSADACSLTVVSEAMLEGQGDIRAGIRALVASDAFRYRQQGDQP